MFDYIGAPHMSIEDSLALNAFWTSMDEPVDWELNITDAEIARAQESAELDGLNDFIPLREQLDAEVEFNKRKLARENSL